MKWTYHTHRKAAAATVACLVGLTSCGGSSDTPGRAAPPLDTTVEIVNVADAPDIVTLQIGTNDGENGAMAAPINEFARQVDVLSQGNIVIEPVWDAGPPEGSQTGEYIAWDQFVARKVVSGELDLGMIPARAWDTEGVTTLRALYAPFLIDSNALLATVVADTDLGVAMMSGLDGAGVVGLALLPESLRHVFAFGDPLTTADDFAGATIRSPRSATTYTLFEALGGRADDMVGAEFDAGALDGSITGAESSFDRASLLPGTRPTVAGNVTPFPNVNSLVINRGVHDGMTDTNRAILAEAAERTRQHMSDNLTDEALAASEYCDGVGDVVAATDVELAALVDAAQPVVDELRRDPRTAELIDQIAQFKAQAPPDTPISPCTYAGAQTASAGATIPAGTYPRTVTREEAETLGVDAGFIDAEIGPDDEILIEYDFSEDGRWVLRMDFCGCGTLDRGDFGNYTYDDEGRLVTTSSNTGSNGLVAVIEWSATDDGISLTSMIGQQPDGTSRALDPIETLLTIGDYVTEH